ncbi:MAG: ATP-binding protein [Verrucomicrobia bacterium]|nr:ATP-binding protein [Verrucomicrobiota bacterium]
MEAIEPETYWIEGNQAYLVAEFVRLKGLFESTSAEVPDGELNEARAALVIPPAIDRLAELFELSAFERDILLLCAGVEMEARIAALCAEALGQSQRTYLTFGLAMAVLPEPHWSALTPSRPLRRFRLVELGAGHGLTCAPLRIDERILHYLAGMNVLDSRLEPLLQARGAPECVTEDHELLAVRMARTFQSCAGRPPVLHLCGDDPHGQEDAAALAAHAAGRYLLVVRSEDIPAAGADWEQIARLWEREALLLPAALLIQCGSGGLTPSARRLTEILPGMIFVASREPARLEPSFLRFDVEKPAPAEQKRLWQMALGPAAAGFNGTLDAVSQHFKLSARTIFATGSRLRADQTVSQPQDLWQACRSLARPKLGDLAQRIVSSAGWDDLVLPELQKQTLRQIASQVRHRMTVYETWGFAAKDDRGLGVSALFTGESGTGKTMAAEVLAAELGLDLYRIDLSAVVSKYIGETEKNLKQVFDAAEDGGTLLLFDEADALFGKRSDVKDSHDRFANIEVSYLLQRMEAYQGLAILTTNLKSSMDRAFQRRIRFTVNFPFPDAAQREAIWIRVFPAKAPARSLDPKKLSQLNVAGGNIRNIALNAAFLAAESGCPVEMKHLLEAARLEAHKIERPLSETEIRGWI